MKSIIAFLVATAIPASAHAYGYATCLGDKLKWSSTSQTLGASPVSFPSGYWRNGLQDGVDAVNLNSSKFRYSLGTDSNVGVTNGDNEVWGDTGSVLGGAPARAYVEVTCYWFFGNHVHVDEMDVLFDYADPWSWTADTTKSSLVNYGGTVYPLQTAVAHEFGHGLMLFHVNYTYNVMGTDTEHMSVNGSYARAYMGEDAARGATYLYGYHAGSWEDLGIVHWKYSGANGEYSDHTKTQLYNTSSAVLPTATVNNETGYRVSPGMRVLAEFTYENMGHNAQNDVVVGYYISTNDLITTDDLRLGSVTLNLSPGTVYTTTVSLRIPSSLTPGKNYYIGAIIDENDRVREFANWNNATYLPIRVQ